ncbi:hypothetical protein AHAS_Ahas03G0164000 [Arachis hypogaea]
MISSALSLLSNVNAVDGTKKLVLKGLREFLNVGDIGGAERYALPIFKACQPHFPNIVDLLLGWALVPDLVDSDRKV